jgi:hypothetical protein
VIAPRTCTQCNSQMFKRHAGEWTHFGRRHDLFRLTCWACGIEESALEIFPSSCLIPAADNCVRSQTPAAEPGEVIELRPFIRRTRFTTPRACQPIEVNVCVASVSVT